MIALKFPQMRVTKRVDLTKKALKRLLKAMDPNNPDRFLKGYNLVR